MIRLDENCCGRNGAIAICDWCGRQQKMSVPKDREVEAVAKVQWNWVLARAHGLPPLQFCSRRCDVEFFDRHFKGIGESDE